jgi:lambda family phage portal protein
MNVFGFLKRAAAAAPVQRVEPVMHRPALPARNRAAHRTFAAANQDRLTASWGSTPMPADQIVGRVQRILVARSREQAANNDYVRAFLRMCRQNIVGPQGVVLNAQVTKATGALDAEVNNGLERDWADWCKPENCDVTGKRSWKRIQDSAVNTAGRDGEYFVRMVYGKDAGPWGFALQTIDPQRCPVELNDPARADGSFVRQGIHFNRYGKPLGYYFNDLYQGSEWAGYGGAATTGTGLFRYVPADEIIHGFIEDMEGQKRGLPWTATGLGRMRHLNGFEDAVIVNARLGASKIGVVQWKEGFGPELEEEEVPEFSAEPGEFMTLPEGAELADWSPQFPSSDTGPFVKHLLRGFAAGAGVPYNEVANDLEGVNFSSIRQGTLDSRENWKDRQEWLVETLCVRVYVAWLQYQLLKGRLTTGSGRPLQASKVDKYMAVTWQPRRWDWIDPNADMKAAEGRKNNLLASPSSVIREHGADPSAVWVETARDMRAMVDAIKAEGFTEQEAKELVLLSMGRQPPKPVPEPKKTEEPANA